MKLFLLLSLTLACSLHAYVLPGTSPTEYAFSAPIELKVVQLDSVKTQIPFSYYQLPFCQPDSIQQSAENLGEIISGDVIQNSDYEILAGLVESCKILCKSKNTQEDLKTFREMIENQYQVHMLLDNLPAATKYTLDGEVRYHKGFPLGFIGRPNRPNEKEGEIYINNHLRFNVLLYSDPDAFVGYRVVGFEVEAFSVHHLYTEWSGTKGTQLSTCTPLNPINRGIKPQPLSGLEGDSMNFLWTYDVNFQKSSTKWGERWDVYLKMSDSNIHWFSIVNSFVIILFLSGMVALIMLRTLNRDFIRYNALVEDREAAEEETGWKLVHGEVFRAPPKGGLLCVLVGSGLQVLGMLGLVIVFAALGFLSPANRGALTTAFLILFACMGFVAGYFSTRLYKLMDLVNWKQNTLYTSMFFPSIAFTIFFSLNLVLWGHNSSAAVPFLTLVWLLVLWFGISTPLVYMGSYYGFASEVSFPLKTVSIPRMIPDQVWYLQANFCIIAGGILPFGAVFFEILFIMSSIWNHQFYYMFGFLLLVFVILILVCSELTIVGTYFQLCAEDYHWWWRSFLMTASAGVYLFLYSFWYFFTKLEIIEFFSGLLFFGYMLLASLTFSLITGTIGFVATYLFVVTIYGSIKVD